MFFSFKEEGSLRTKGSLGPSTHLESVKTSGLLPLLLTQIVSLLVKPVFLCFIWTQFFPEII